MPGLPNLWAQYRLEFLLKPVERVGDQGHLLQVAFDQLRERALAILPHVFPKQLTVGPGAHYTLYYPRLANLDKLVRDETRLDAGNSG